jgi:hypothetical protein
LKPTTNEDPDNCAIRPEPVLPPLDPDPLPDLIKPIETRYKGHRFRSRLEARWAVFFDHLGIDWLYEPEGFMIGSQPYLPDFWLPKWRCWVEVKGVLDQPTLDLLLAAADGKTGLPADPTGRRWTRSDSPGRLILLGNVPDSGADGWLHTRFDFREGSVARSSIAFVEFPGLEPEWNSEPGMMLVREPIALDRELWPTNPTSRSLIDGCRDQRLRPDSEIRDAYRAARAARFEHGEHGAPKAVLKQAPRDTDFALTEMPRQVSNSADVLWDGGQFPARKRPLEEASRLPWFKPFWPKIVDAVAAEDSALGEVLGRARVFKVIRQTVTLVFKNRADRQAAEDGTGTIRKAIISVTERKPWGVKCKLACSQHEVESNPVLPTA